MAGRRPRSTFPRNPHTCTPQTSSMKPHLPRFARNVDKNHSFPFSSPPFDCCVALSSFRFAAPGSERLHEYHKFCHKSTHIRAIVEQRRALADVELGDDVDIALESQIYQFPPRGPIPPGRTDTARD